MSSSERISLSTRRPASPPHRLTNWTNHLAGGMADEVTIHEAKTHLSRLVQRAHAGEEIVIRRGKVPMAKLVRYDAAPVPRVPAGCADRSRWPPTSTSWMTRWAISSARPVTARRGHACVAVVALGRSAVVERARALIGAGDVPVHFSAASVWEAEIKAAIRQARRAGRSPRRARGGSLRRVADRRPSCPEAARCRRCIAIRSTACSSRSSHRRARRDQRDRRSPSTARGWESVMSDERSDSAVGLPDLLVSSTTRPTGSTTARRASSRAVTPWESLPDKVDLPRTAAPFEANFRGAGARRGAACVVRGVRVASCARRRELLRA